jgi:hypothetical protein
MQDPRFGMKKMFGSGSGIRKWSDSGLNILDPQHCFQADNLLTTLGLERFSFLSLQNMLWVCLLMVQKSMDLILLIRVGKNPVFFKKPSPVGFFGFYWVFWIFFFNFCPIKSIFLPLFVLFIYLLADEFKIR